MMTDKQLAEMKRVKEVVDQTRTIIEALEEQILTSLEQKFDAWPDTARVINRRRLKFIRTNLMEISCDLS